MIAIINGPNLNLTGRRQPEIYGFDTLDVINEMLAAEMPDTEFHFFQSNCEGDLITRVQQLGFDPGVKGIVINPGALAHYSYALADAIAAAERPVIEVHLSNIHARAEQWRHTSVTAAACRAIVAGMGAKGYLVAARFIESL